MTRSDRVATSRCGDSRGRMRDGLVFQFKRKFLAFFGGCVLDPKTVPRHLRHEIEPARLVVSLEVIVLGVLGDELAQVPLAKWDDAPQAFLPERAHPSFRVGVQAWTPRGELDGRYPMRARVATGLVDRWEHRPSIARAKPTITVIASPVSSTFKLGHVACAPTDE